jgi:GT2 family glycosyltransferase
MLVSVIIPVKTISDIHLSECLTSIENQSFNGVIEIIVIKEGNIAEARNLGIKASKGDIIAFIDSDCIAQEDWLEILIKYLTKLNKAGGVGGPNISPPNSSLISKSIDEIFSIYIGSLGSPSLYIPKSVKEVKTLACINSIYWKKALIEAEGFDERFQYNEDTNLSHRVRKKGYKLYFVPDSIVYHYRKDNAIDFFKQFFVYGVSRTRSILTNMEYLNIEIFIPLILFSLFPILFIYYRSIATLMVLIYMIILISSSINKSIKLKNIKLLLTMPFFYIFQHVGYAFGLLYGITKGKWTTQKGEPKLCIYKIINNQYLNHFKNGR